MTRSRLLAASLATLAAVTATAGAPREARAQAAQTYSFTFSGAGVAGTLVVTYGAATDAKYANAYEATAISGTFTDTNNGLNIVNAPVGAFVPVNHATPEDSNFLAPHDFSRFAVASGLPPDANGYVTYDNLLWPGGSPQTGSDYPPHGGFLDVYGLLVNIGGGAVVNFWSNGADSTGAVDYGASVATVNTALDYAGSGVTATAAPEPGAVWMVGVGGVGLLVAASARRRRLAAVTSHPALSPSSPNRSAARA